jgi:hypothetical protein
MNSFKTDVLESRVDTIGNKYPFIFRNGNVAYKEFPIGGLISYLSDEEGLFLELDFDDSHRERTRAKQKGEWRSLKVPTNNLEEYNF